MTTTFWIQFLGVCFGLGMMYFTFVKYKRKEISPSELVAWEIIWTILALLGIFPFILDPIISQLHFYRRLDFFVVIGFFILLGLGFYNYSAVRKMERKLEQFVRSEALKTEKNIPRNVNTSKSQEP
jgi:hypothetical protein